MTDLLAASRRRQHPDGSRSGRPLVATALGAGVAAATAGLLVAVAVALAGWFAADAGRYGDTRDAVRVGADAWLLAHGAGLRLADATVTLLPLGLTLVLAMITARVGRRTARATGLDTVADTRALATAVGVLAVGYALVALLTAVLAAHPVAESDLLRALLGGFLLGVVAGGAGMLSASGRLLPPGLPEWARTVLVGAAVTVLLMVAAGAALVAAGLLADFGTAATVLSRLHTDGPGGLMYTLVAMTVVPNAVVLAGTYLLGPGFMVGAGTVVSPTAVVLGPLPAFPLLAALPGDDATPTWTTALLGAPVFLAAFGALVTVVRAGVTRLDTGALRGLGIGLLAAAAFSLLVLLAGGSAGPGRMAEVGAPFGSTLLAAAVSLGGGGLVGGVVGAWRCRRRGSVA